MAEQGLTVRLKTDTSGFKKGMDEVVKELEKYNKALVDNQYKQRDCNKVISAAQKEIKDLKKIEQEKGQLDDSQKKRLQELTNTIEEEKVKLSQLRTEQASLRNVISETTRSLTENEKGWSVLKGTLANLASDTLKQLGSELVNVARSVVQTGEQFSASMSEVGAISGATAEELQELEEAARLYGATTKFSATEAADALKYMALAGWDSQQAIAGLPAVLDLAAASGMDLGRASDIVTDYITAFGLEVEDASRFVDIMSYAMSNSNTTTEMLGEAYKNCAATAKSMGFSVEETTAALMTMANAGVKGGEAGTTLNTLMTRLATNTKGCADALKKYGVEIYDSQGNMNSLSEIMNGLIAAFNTLNQEEQANLSKMIAGTNQYAGFQTLMQGMSEKVKEAGMSFEDYTAALQECDGTASDMAKTMSDNLSGDLKTLESALDELRLKLYDDAEQPLRNLVKLATNEGVAALEGIIKNLNAVLPVIVGAATAMSTLKINLTIGKIVAELTSSTNALKTAMQGAAAATEMEAGAQQQLNVAMSANVIGLVITAVVSLTAALGTLAAMSADNADAFDNANEKAKNYLGTLNSLDEKQQQSIDNIDGKADALRKQAEVYDQLRNAENLTAEQEKQLDTVANDLAQTLGITIEQLKEKDGTYKDLTKDIDAYIEKLKEQAILENNKEGLEAATVAYDKASKAAKEYAQKIKEQSKAIEADEKRLKELQDKVDNYTATDADYEERLKLTKQLEEEKITLDSLKTTWSDYYIQTQTAAEKSMEYTTALGGQVDEEKELDKALLDAGGDILGLITKTDELADAQDNAAQSTENFAVKSTSSSASAAGSIQQINEKIQSTSDSLQKYQEKAEHFQKLMDTHDPSDSRWNNWKSSLDDAKKGIERTSQSLQDLQMQMDFAADSSQFFTGKLSQLQSQLQANKSKQEELNAAIEDCKDAVKELDEESDSDEIKNYNKQISDLKAQVKNLTDEEKELNKAIETQQGIVNGTAEAFSNAFAKVQSSADLLAKAEKEANENGSLTLNTVNSILKTYPELIDLTNDYINGVKTEKDMIEGLKQVYENDKNDYANVIFAKKLASMDFSENTVDNLVTMVNEMKDKYDIDAENFAHSADAKLAVQKMLYAQMLAAKAEYDKVVNDSTFTKGNNGYREYYMKKDPSTGEWREATEAEIKERNAIIQRYFDTQNALSDYQNDPDSMIAQIFSAYRSGQTTAQNLGSFSTGSNSNSGGNGGNSNSGSNKSGSSEKSVWKMNSGGIEATGNSYSDAYMNWIDKMKSLGRIPLQQEIDILEQLKKRTDNSADDIYRIEKNLYDATGKLRENEKKEKEEAEKAEKERNSKKLDDELKKIAHKKALNQLSSEDEIAWYDKILAEFELTEDERNKIIETRASVYNQFYKKQREEEEKFYQEQLNLALAAYNCLVDGKIENYKKEADAAKKTADAEIKAINDAAKARKQDKDAQEREKKIAALNAKLSYEHLDDFSRRELQKEIAEIQAEQDEVNLELDEEKQRTHWNNYATNAADFFQQAIDGLNAGKNLFADRVAALLGNQSYDQRVANNTTTQNINIIQNNLSADQVVNKLLKELGVTK